MAFAADVGAFSALCGQDVGIVLAEKHGRAGQAA